MRVASSDPVVARGRSDVSPKTPCSSTTWQRAVDTAMASAGAPGAIIVLELPSGSELASAQVESDATLARAPASTLKPFVALAALEAGAVTATTTRVCDGGWERDGLDVSCHGEHGELDVVRALASSCNVFFAEAAARLGADRLARAFARHGLDGIAGAIEQHANDLGRVMTTSLGHGDARVTPRTLAAAYVRLWSERSTSFEVVAAGLRAAVEDPRGSATGAMSDRITIAGKTGSHAAEPGEAGHAWFVGVAPASSPRVLTLVLLEHRGREHLTPPAVARTVFETCMAASVAPSP